MRRGVAVLVVGLVVVVVVVDRQQRRQRRRRGRRVAGRLPRLLRMPAARRRTLLPW